MEQSKPKNYFGPPIKAARWFSYLNVGRYGKYNNYYLVCLPMPNYEQRCSRSFSRHNVEESVSCSLTELTPLMAESYAGVHNYKVGEHIKLRNYCQDTKDNEVSTHGRLFGTLITSVDYSVSCTRWDMMMVDHQALKGLNDLYWKELGDMQRSIYFKDFEVTYGYYGDFPESTGLHYLIWLDRNKGLATGLDMKALPLERGYGFVIHWMRDGSSYCCI